MTEKKVRETLFLWVERRKERDSGRSSRISLGSLCTMTSCVVFGETNVGTLLFLMRNSPLVVAYDSNRDFKLLEKYNNYSPLRSSLRFVDLRMAIEANCDFRPFFHQTVEHTLCGDALLGEGVGEQLRYGNLKRAVELVEMRGGLVKDLYHFLITNGFALTRHKDGGDVKRIKVEADFLQPNYFVQ